MAELESAAAARTTHKVAVLWANGGAVVKVAGTLEGVQSGVVAICGYCFCFEPSNLPLHAFQVMLPFGTMSPERSVKMARAVYERVPFMIKAFEDKYNQVLLSLIADNGYNLGPPSEWTTVAEPTGQNLSGASLPAQWSEIARAGASGGSGGGGSWFSRGAGTPPWCVQVNVVRAGEFAVAAVA